MGLTYADHETRISRAYLERVLRVAADPVWIIGGWGVWFAVREGFHRATGREYAFSRDIDLGFHVEPSWGEEELLGSSLARTSRELTETLDFKGQGFRLYREFHTETGEPLTPQDAARLPRHFVFPLCIDLMVDHQHPLCRKVLGFAPVDEPCLRNVAARGGTPLPEVSPRLSLPDDADLLAMKLAALPGRPRDDKRVKDMADIFALLAFGRTRTTERLAGVRGSEAANEARGGGGARGRDRDRGGPRGDDAPRARSAAPTPGVVSRPPPHGGRAHRGPHRAPGRAAAGAGAPPARGAAQALPAAGQEARHGH